MNFLIKWLNIELIFKDSEYYAKKDNLKRWDMGQTYVIMTVTI